MVASELISHVTLSAPGGIVSGIVVFADTIFGSLVADRKTTHSYGAASLPVTVGDGDVSDAKMEVPELAVEK